MRWRLDQNGPAEQPARAMLDLHEHFQRPGRQRRRIAALRPQARPSRLCAEAAALGLRSRRVNWIPPREAESA